MVNDLENVEYHHENAPCHNGRGIATALFTGILAPVDFVFRRAETGCFVINPNSLPCQWFLDTVLRCVKRQKKCYQHLDPTLRNCKGDFRRVAL